MDGRDVIAAHYLVASERIVDTLTRHWLAKAWIQKKRVHIHMPPTKPTNSQDQALAAPLERLFWLRSVGIHPRWARFLRVSPSVRVPAPESPGLKSPHRS